MTTTVDRLRRELGELLERYERARDLDEFSAYAADPVGFIRDVLGGEPWSAQEELAEAVRGEPLTVVRSCNSAGKDWIAARLALWWTYCRRGLVLLTGAHRAPGTRDRHDGSPHGVRQGETPPGRTVRASVASGSRRPNRNPRIHVH